MTKLGRSREEITTEIQGTLRRGGTKNEVPDDHSPNVCVETTTI